MVKQRLFAKRICFFCFFGMLSGGIQAFGQFYFQDHLTQGQAADNYRLLVKQRVTKVLLQSVLPDGSNDPDFSITQTVESGKRKLITESKTTASRSSVLTVQFDNQLRPILNQDTTADARTTTRFFYHPTTGLLDSAVSEAESTIQEDANKTTEKRLYSYTPEGRLRQMQWVRSAGDTTIVLFDLESNGQPGTERWIRNGQKTETYFYYYDTDNRLTDLVRLYSNVDKLLPVYVFGYDEKDRLLMQTSFLPGSNEYTIYQYNYLENGLRKSESVFNKQKQQVGRVVYTYTSR